MSAVVIIVSWEGVAILPACLEALAPQLSPENRLLVVDNASHDDAVACVYRACPDAQVIENSSNLGFGGGVNTGLRALLRARPPDYVVLLNQDAIVAPGWLEGMLRPFDSPRVGAVGCKLLYPDGTLQHAGAYLEYPRAIAQHIGWHQPDDGRYDLKRDIDYVTGASLALRVTALRRVGLFDEGYNPGYYEDSDLLWRLRRAGYRVVYTGSACAVHHESTSTADTVRRGMLYNRNRLRFILKTLPARAFWEDFVPAERMFIARHGVGDEARALRWAYLHALIALPDTLAARQPLHPADPLDHYAVARVLVSLRRLIGAYTRARLI